MYKREDVRRSEGRGKSWWRGGGGSKGNSERKQSSYFQSICLVDWTTRQRSGISSSRELREKSSNEKDMNDFSLLF